MKNNFTKNELKLIAKLYAGQMLNQIDCGYDPKQQGLTEDDADYLTEQVNRIGQKLMGKYETPTGSLGEIVKYVNDMFYE